MKKSLAAALMLLGATTAYSAPLLPPSWGAIFYASGGYSADTVTYTSTAALPTRVDASGLVLELGGSVRWIPVTFLAAEATVGSDWYTGVDGALTRMGTLSPFGSSTIYTDSSDYASGDDESIFLAADVYLCLPFLPFNLFAGYKHNWFIASLVTTMVGSDELRFGVEILATRFLSVKIAGEIPFAYGATYTMMDGATVSPGSGYNITAEAVYRFDSGE